MNNSLANKRWCQEHPGARRANQKRYISSSRGAYMRLQSSANHHHKPLEFTFEEFASWRNAQPCICHYCGKFLILHGRSPDSISIDRKDNSTGYCFENMVLACYSCNSTKQERGVDYLLELLKLNSG